MKISEFAFAKNYEIFLRKPQIQQILVGESSFIKELRKIAVRLSGNNVPVLLCGETGTGKTLLAETVYYLTGKNWNNFFTLNSNCLEEKDFISLLEEADKLSESLEITLFVKNIENTGINLQNKLLELLKSRNNNIRFIFSTEKNSESLSSVSENLLFLISSMTVNFLPLRQRPEDILYITSYFFKTLKLKTGIKMEGFAEDCVKEIKTRYWKGNCSELKNALERAFLTGKVPCIYKSDMGFSENSVAEEAVNRAKTQNNGNLPLKDALDTFKKMYLTKILEENNWNQTKTAKILGIQRTYVIKLINDLNINKNR